MEDVADSTDWLSTPLKGLAPLESGLRCQICKDFFTTPMITSCSHTFCSLCIRRVLSQEGRCPTCRESDQELKLRHNWALEEVVAHFTQAREGVLRFAQREIPVAQPGVEVRPKKRRKIDHVPPTTNGESGSRRSTRSQSKKTAVSASQVNQAQVLSDQEMTDSEDAGSAYYGEGSQTPRRQSRQENRNAKEPNDGLVECPCCTRHVKESAINAHLDRCMSGLPTSPEPAPASTNNSALPFVQRTKSPVVTSAKDRLPPINYALYTDSSLRKKLKDLGIPNHGNKELMRKRHTEWMNLWNANCDSLRPRPKSQLLRDLDIWERTLGKQLEKTVAAGGASGVMVKDFDRDGWAKNQKNEFDDLIRKAREKRKAAASENRDSKGISDEGGKDKDTPMTELTQQTQRSNSHVHSDGDREAHDTKDIVEQLVVNGNSDRNSDEVPEDAPMKTSEPQTPPKGKEVSLSAQIASNDLTLSPVPATGLLSGTVEGAETPRKRSRFFV